MADAAKTEWFEDGLSFTCTQCGNCCTGPAGYVWFDGEELFAMADHFGIDPEAFLRTYARQVEDGRWSLKEVERDGLLDCVFLKRNEKTGGRVCSIYAVRPQQCRTWPFWPENLRSRRAYRAAAKNTPCPGMLKGLEGEGRFYPVEEVRIQRDSNPHG